MNNMTFKSKVDAWLLVAIYVVVLGALLAKYASQPTPKAWAIDTIICGLVLTYVTYLLFAFKYEFRGDALVIHVHPFVTKSIKLDSIRKVQATTNPLASPAASLDRLKITFADGTVLISPKDKAAFVARLQALCPQPIVVEL